MDNGYEDSSYPESRTARANQPTLFTSLMLAFLKRPWITIVSLFVITIPSLFYIYSRAPLYSSSAVVSTVRSSIANSMGGLLGADPRVDAMGQDNFYLTILESHSFYDAILQRVLEEHPDWSVSADSIRRVIRRSVSASAKPRVNGFFIIRATSDSPEFAYLLAVKALESLKQISSDRRREETSNTSAFIESQLVELNRDLGQTEADIQAFLRNRNLAIDDPTEGIDAELRNLGKELASAQAARDIAKRHIDSFTAEQSEGVSAFLQLSTNKEENDRLIAIRERLRHINSINADSLIVADSVAFGNIQSERRKLLNQILQANAASKSQNEGGGSISLPALEEKLETLQLEYQMAQNQCLYYEAKIEEFRRNHPDLPNDILEFFQITQTKAVLTKTIDILVELREKKRIEMASETGGITILDNPVVPTSPINEKRLIKLIVAIFAGLGLGILVSYVIDFLDNTVQNESEIQDRFGLAVLGSVPVLDQAKSAPRHSHSHRPSSSRAKPSNESDEQVNMKRLDNLSETSPISEAYRAIKTSILFSSRDRGQKVFVITSPVASDGKSITTHNIGISLAQGGLRVLLIDADLRRASQHKLFQIDRKDGLADVLVGALEIKQAIHESHTKNFFVMPAGQRVSNPGELVSSHLMKKLIEDVSGMFDLVLIDTPPITPCMDSRHLALMVGGMILVVRAERTKLNVLEHSINLCRRVGVEITGVIVNHATFRYGYGYYYLYQRYNPYGYYYSGYQYYYNQDPETGEKVRKKRRKSPHQPDSPPV